MTARAAFMHTTPRDEDEPAGDVMGLESEPLQSIEEASSAAEAVVIPLTEGEWQRVLGGRDFRILAKREQIEWAGKRAVRCINCKRAGRPAGGHDPWRGYCLEFACMVSNTFTKLCPAYKPV